MSFSACRALSVSPRFMRPPRYLYHTFCNIVGEGYPVPRLGLLIVAAYVSKFCDVIGLVGRIVLRPVRLGAADRDGWIPCKVD
jgi:hypothetical protein